jgi:hypothetical protein
LWGGREEARERPVAAMNGGNGGGASRSEGAAVAR